MEDSKITSKFASEFRKQVTQTSYEKENPERSLQIGVWCNGNTTDSGPVILGSSPSTPTFINDCFTKSKTVVLFLSEKRVSQHLGSHTDTGLPVFKNPTIHT